MSANGGRGRGLANGRPLGAASEPLLVPSADVTAKNLRASLHNRTASGSYDSDGRMQRRAMSILDKVVGVKPGEDGSSDKDAAPKFTRLVDDSPSILTQLQSFIYRMRTQRKSKKSAQKKSASSTPAESNAVYKSLARLCDVIEYSPLPPMVYFLGATFLIVVLKLTEPVRLLEKFPHIPLVLEGMLVVSALITVLWRRSRIFYALARGDSPYSHPIDACFEPYAEYIAERAAQVKLETEVLAENHAKLDALRKELAKDPAAHIPGSVLKPSRKAAAMIREGALGAGYDAEKAAEAEEMRKKERQRESHKLWREKSLAVQNNTNGDKDEELKKITKHATTGYKKHTKDLKMRAAPRPPPAVNAFKQASAAVVGASSAASAFAGLAAGNIAGQSSRRGSGETNRDQSGSSGGRREGSGSGASGMGMGGDTQANSFSVFGTGHIHHNNLDMNLTRRSSGGSDLSVRTAASGPVNAVVSRQNSKHFKMHLFSRRKRSNNVVPPLSAPVLSAAGSTPPLATASSAPLPLSIGTGNEMTTAPMTFTVPLNGNDTQPVALADNTLPDSTSGVLGENVSSKSNRGSRRNSKTHSRLPSFSRLSAKRRSKTMNLNRKPDRDKI